MKSSLTVLHVFAKWWRTKKNKTLNPFIDWSNATATIKPTILKSVSSRSQNKQY